MRYLFKLVRTEPDIVLRPCIPGSLDLFPDSGLLPPKVVRPLFTCIGRTGAPRMINQRMLGEFYGTLD